MSEICYIFRTLARAAAARRLCDAETLLEFPEPQIGLAQFNLESRLRPGSAAKAAFSLERSCPNISMAPVVAIM
jgi:hypothetical protein